MRKLMIRINPNSQERKKSFASLDHTSRPLNSNRRRISGHGRVSVEPFDFERLSIGIVQKAPLKVLIKETFGV